MLKLLESIAYRDTNQFPKLFLDYIDQKKELNDFFNHSPDLKGFKKIISERSSFSSEQRVILQNHFIEQYDGLELPETVERNINLISDQNTFTLTTGHQLNLFTGPLYFIYKILTVINLSEKLKNEFPDKNFIPVYWMASEDHDFEEIQYFNFEGKKYTWESSQNGAVGRFSLDNIQEYLNSTHLPDNYKRFYSESKTLGEAHLKLVNHLFSEYGLLVLDADSKALKGSFSKIIEKDIQSRISFNQTEQSTKALSSVGYNTPVNPRKINYFFLDNGIRERIEQNKEEYFYTLNGENRYIDIESILDSNPECISPNVITRPLYQEYVLPNLAYIGGPSELSYWLQLKSTFDALNINFPILMPRYSSSVLSEKALNKLREINLDDFQMLFKDEREVLKSLLLENNLLDNKQHSEWAQAIENLFAEVRIEAEKKDRTLGPSVEGRKKKVLKELEKIQKKMETAEIRNQVILKDRFYYAIEELFPNGSFQERYENIFKFSMENENFISNLKSEYSDPLEFTHLLFKA